MPFDAAHTHPTCRPGERLVAGKVSVFNANLLNLHVAHEVVLAAPADLTRLTYAEVDALANAALKVAAASPSLLMSLPYRVSVRFADAVAARACDERACRPEYPVAFRGEAA